MQTRTKPMTKCEDCRGHGWLLCQVDSNPIDLEIERCDNCERFSDDNGATKHVAKLAWRERPNRRVKRAA